MNETYEPKKIALKNNPVFPGFLFAKTSVEQIVQLSGFGWYM